MDRFAKSNFDQQTIYDIYRACRLCGAGAGYKMPIIQNVELDGRDVELKQKIRECIQLEVSHDDKMPPLICELCVDKVNDFYEFLEMCRQTNKKTRLRLGLPAQAVSRGATEPADCILGLSEPVFINDNSNELISKHKSKASKSKVKRETEKKIKVEIKVDEKPKTGQFYSSGKRKTRGTNPSPPPPSRSRRHNDNHQNQSKKTPTQLKSILKKEKDIKVEDNLLIPRSKRSREKETRHELPLKRVKISAVESRSSRASKPVSSAKGPSHACDICGKEFASLLSVSNHRKTHKQAQMRQNSTPPAETQSVRGGKCSNCGRVYQTRKNYLRHTRSCSIRTTVPQAVVDPWVLRSLKQLRVRIARCDPLLPEGGGPCLLERVPQEYGLDRRYTYPYISSVRSLRGIKSEPATDICDGMVQIGDEIKQELEEGVNWDFEAGIHREMPKSLGAIALEAYLSASNPIKVEAEEDFDHVHDLERIRESVRDEVANLDRLLGADDDNIGYEGQGVTPEEADGDEETVDDAVRGGDKVDGDSESGDKVDGDSKSGVGDVGHLENEDQGLDDKDIDQNGGEDKTVDSQSDLRDGDGDLSLDMGDEEDRLLRGDEEGQSGVKDGDISRELGDEDKLLYGEDKVDDDGGQSGLNDANVDDLSKDLGDDEDKLLRDDDEVDNDKSHTSLGDDKMDIGDDLVESEVSERLGENEISQQTIKENDCKENAMETSDNASVTSDKVLESTMSSEILEDDQNDCGDSEKREQIDQEFGEESNMAEESTSQCSERQNEDKENGGLTTGEVPDEDEWEEWDCKKNVENAGIEMENRVISDGRNRDSTNENAIADSKVGESENKVTSNTWERDASSDNAFSAPDSKLSDSENKVTSDTWAEKDGKVVRSHNSLTSDSWERDSRRENVIADSDSRVGGSDRVTSDTWAVRDIRVGGSDNTVTSDTWQARDKVGGSENTVTSDTWAERGTKVGGSEWESNVRGNGEGWGEVGTNGGASEGLLELALDPPVVCDRDKITLDDLLPGKARHGSLDLDGVADEFGFDP